MRSQEIAKQSHAWRRACERVRYPVGCHDTVSSYPRISFHLPIFYPPVPHYSWLLPCFPFLRTQSMIGAPRCDIGRRWSNGFAQVGTLSASSLRDGNNTFHKGLQPAKTRYNELNLLKRRIMPCGHNIPRNTIPAIRNNNLQCPQSEKIW